MNSKRILAVALAGLLTISWAGVAAAKGGNGQGGGGGKCNTSTTRTQSQAQTRSMGSTTRPADSQRRDGTFLTTGVTANGSTSRPANGKGLQDGSGLTAAPVQ